MKKTLACCLAVIMMMSVCSADAEGEPIPFEPTLLNSFEQTADAWYAHPYVHALFMISMGFDLAAADEAMGSILLYDVTYIGRDGDLLIGAVRMQDTQKGVVATYDTVKHTAYYELYEFSDYYAGIEPVMLERCTMGYYQNSPEVMTEVTMMVVEALQDAQ